MQTEVCAFILKSQIETSDGRDTHGPLSSPIILYQESFMFAVPSAW